MHSKNKLILLILLIFQKSALCIKPKDKLMCGASPSWGILLLKSQLPPLSRPMYTPIYTALGSSLLFLLERKGTRQPWFKKKKPSDKIPPLWNSQECCSGVEGAKANSF